MPTRPVFLPRAADPAPIPLGVPFEPVPWSGAVEPGTVEQGDELRFPVVGEFESD